MADWRDGLARVTLSDGRRMIGGSFRGVPFFVSESDYGGGRRQETHEFPFREEEDVEDLGRAARNYRVVAHVVGEDYLRQRDELRAALEDVPGPGLLVHPYYGRVRASCGLISVRESTRDGGMAIFQINFHRAPAPAAPTEIVDLGAAVDAAAAAAHAAAVAQLEDSYDTAGQPAFALESLASELSDLSEGLGRRLAPIVQGTQELALLSVELDILTKQASSLIREPGEVIGAFLGAVTQVAESLVNVPRSLLRALVGTYVTPAIAAAQGETATRIRERANQEALGAALRSALAIEAARLLPRVAYQTLEDAKADRATVVELLDEQAGAAGDTLYPALVELRTAVIRAVPGDAVLARVQTIERPTAVPSLLLSYQLYGTVRGEPDLIARNRTRHPGFMSGALEVLSRG